MVTERAFTSDVSRVFQDIGLDINQIGSLIGSNRVSDQDQFRETESKDFGAVLGGGGRPGFDVTGNRVSITGSPGAICKTPITIKGSAIIRNVTFKCDGVNPAIVVEPTARLVLVGCHLFKGNRQASATDSYVNIQAGGFAVVSDCMFHGTQTVGLLVRNQDAVNTNYAAVSGCINLTGLPSPACYLNVGSIVSVP
tara:strand:- start:12133 stop:12720 length:588 start_codon:yes stop_codon:yes gene_type:complete